MNLIGGRIQAVIEQDDDPQDLADLACRQLWDAGLTRLSSGVAWSDFGMALIVESHALRERLAAWNALLPPEIDTPVECLDCLPAREVLQDERRDPRNGLELWLTAVTRLPD